MPLTRQTMLRAMLAADATFDGQFITGVTSTGIYCLPSCRARKPKPENVVFYSRPADARQGGLRACRRCHPDDFYAGIHADELKIEALNALPVAGLPDVPALARAAQLSVRALHDLLRDHLGVTPADYLGRARVEAARDLLRRTSRTATDIAFEVGFASLSTFGEQFRRHSALTPQAYRQLPGAAAFTLRLPAGYAVDRLLAHLGRDPGQTTEQVAGCTLRVALRLPDGVQVVKVTFRPDAAEVMIRAPLSAGDAAALHVQLLRLLGLTSRPARFERLAAGQPLMAGVVARHRGLHVPLSATPFDALLWAVAGQQVTFTLACTLRRRLCERLDERAEGGLYAPPSPQGIVTLNKGDLTRMGFTGARAELLMRLAQLCLTGELDLAALSRGSVRTAERHLTAIPGVGPWTANYVLLRGLGAADVIPLGDSALATALQHLHDLPARPDARQVSRLLAPFAPHRSLATLHLWQHFTTLKEKAS